jgi:hypothetical protein
LQRRDSDGEDVLWQIDVSGIAPDPTPLPDEAVQW